jgi:hypothetical protein
MHMAGCHNVLVLHSLIHVLWHHSTYTGKPGSWATQGGEAQWNSHVRVAGSGDSMPIRIGGVTSPPAMASECCRPVMPAVMMPRGW